ncbi:MAG: hypothetical protein M1155_01285 [Patescibacteria group bacterium]|nr:hypothetical protein [Patescibacteria group bacterium]
MNKKVVFILFLAISALSILYLYSFGPMAGIRTAKNFNPASLRPSTSANLNIANKNEIFNTYHNKDVKENYYTIQIPKDWLVNAGKDPGSYNVTATNSSTNGWIGLMDVPDNSTLELYILSQDEPKLKKSATAYTRVNYEKTTVSGNDAYELSYTSISGNDTYHTIRVYIAGQDHAGLIVLSSKQQNIKNMQQIFDTIIKSFSWENK